MIVQIYEIQTPADAQEMILLGVDHIGSVIESPSQCCDPRLKETVVTVQRAGRKSSLIPLFCDLDAIITALEYYRPDIVHFCDTLPLPFLQDDMLSQVVDRQAFVRRKFSHMTIMRSIPIGLPGSSHAIPSLQWAAMFEPISDFFLTDTLLTPGTIPPVDETHNMSAPAVEQPVEGFVGITGRICDWDIARQLVQSCQIPVILAGGIGPDNVAEGIRTVGPMGIDSCTQTNARDSHGRIVRFRKDHQKVMALILAARHAT